MNFVVIDRTNVLSKNIKKEKVDISLRLRYLRKSCNLKMHEMASLLDVATSTYSGYETPCNSKSHRQPTLATLNAIADLFNVSVDYLLGNTDCKERQENINVVDFIQNESEGVLSEIEAKFLIERLDQLRSHASIKRKGVIA